MFIATTRIIPLDRLLDTHPADMDALLRLLEDEGFTVKHGKHITLRHPDFQRVIRLDSLGDGY